MKNKSLLIISIMFILLNCNYIMASSINNISDEYIYNDTVILDDDNVVYDNTIYDTYTVDNAEYHLLNYDDLN